MALKALHFIKNEALLCISAVLALFSMLLITPSAKYLEYIDFRTLALLLCLMAVTAGFSRLGIFDYIARVLLSHVHSPRTLAAVLIFLCFFSSMLITNDVALITFVPLSIMLLRAMHLENHMIGVISLQTVAANLGSMLTPIGNPQNLYLYNLSGMSLLSFIEILLPYTLLSFLLLAASCFLIPFKEHTLDAPAPQQTEGSPSRSKLALYIILFVLSLLAVLQLMPYQFLLVLVLAAVILWDRPALKNVDYSLLCTFLCFFIFIGNIGSIPYINSLLRETIAGNEVLFGVLSSQIISNVPAAVLLSGFSNDPAALLIGVDIGGLGTLIASMASLISYRFYVKTESCHAGRYLLVFTLINLAFLALNLLLYGIIG